MTLIDRIAPEHLELAVEDPDAIAARVRHAGAIFLGRHTPEAIGDYVAGPNHVLPTARSARFASGLGVLDFMKRTTLVGCDPREPGRARPVRDPARRSRGAGRARAVADAPPGRLVTPATPDSPAMRIADITLDEHTVLARSEAVENERAAAISDLLKDNYFAPCSGLAGRSRCISRSRKTASTWRSARSADGSVAAGGASETIVLPLAPFRRIVKDYFLICESYYKAIRDRGFAQVEAIDAGRRSLHDEGAELLMERLAGKVAIDHATARRLFTLLCVLHLRA